MYTVPECECESQVRIKSRSRGVHHRETGGVIVPATESRDCKTTDEGGRGGRENSVLRKEGRGGVA